MFPVCKYLYNNSNNNNNVNCDTEIWSAFCLFQIVYSQVNSYLPYTITNPIILKHL